MAYTPDPKRLAFLIALWRYRQALHALGLYAPVPYDPRKPRGL
jgi:hypothetical protein